MSDDFDVEAMLEAPFESPKRENNGHDGTNGHSRRRSKEKDGEEEPSSKSRRDEKERDREGRRRSRDRKKRSRSRSPKSKKDRKRSRSPRKRSKSPRRRSRSPGGRRRSRSPGGRRSPRRRPSRSPTRRRPSRSPPRRRPSRSPPRRRLSKSPPVPKRSRSRSKERRRRSRSPPIIRRRSRSRSPFRRGGSVTRKPGPDLTVEERDMRTVFCMQLSQRIRSRDLEEFFSAVGKVRDVRLITDNKTRRSKGIAYVEFVDVDSVPLAMGLNGQKLFGIPIVVQPTQAERNRAAAAQSAAQQAMQQAAQAMNSLTNLKGPLRLFVGSLHFSINEDMLRGIFEPFGRVDKIDIVRDIDTGRSKGYGFVTFHDVEEGKRALEQLNGFELAGRQMKVNVVTEKQMMSAMAVDGGPPSFLDNEELDRAGIELGATGRLALMAKLAEGTGVQLPEAAKNALQMAAGGPAASYVAAPLVASVAAKAAAATGMIIPPPIPNPQPTAPPIATQCFMLSNMFDPVTETNPSWDAEIRNDVLEECAKHGGALHVFVDKASPQGNVYVKCPTIATAVASVNALHGRYFAGRVITAAYVPVVSYHTLFPDATALTHCL